MATTSGSVMLRAAAHLNDLNQLVYNNTVLLPFFQMALDELQEELSVYEIGDMKKVSITIQVPAGSTVIPQMPTDFLETISILERPAGGGGHWREIKEWRNIDSNVTNSTEILQWSERSSNIYINPPMSDREIILEYISIMNPTNNSSAVIDIETSRRYLALVTARNAARDLGNSITKAQTYDADIARARDRLTRRLQKKSQHSMGVRRRAYRGRG